MREKASIVLLRYMARSREQRLAYTCKAGEGGKEENNLESSLAEKIRKEYTIPSLDLGGTNLQPAMLQELQICIYNQQSRKVTVVIAVKIETHHTETTHHELLHFFSSLCNILKFCLL